MAPPYPLLLTPATRLMVPARPEVAVPVIITTGPLFPELEVPVDSVMLPETPADATFAELTTTGPEPELELAPLMMLTAPPVAVDVVVPPDNNTNPAVPELPDPARMLIPPARPEVAVPLWIKMYPLFP